MDAQYQSISNSQQLKHNKNQTQMDYEYAEYIVFVFAHQIERENGDSFRYPFPKCILDVCLLFYFIPFIPLNESIVNKVNSCPRFLKEIELNTDVILPTPFTLLFAIFNKNTLLNMKGWRLMDISEQLKYLQHVKINTDDGRQQIINELSEKKEFFLEMNGSIKIQNQIKYVLSMYVQNRLRLLNATNIEEWTDYDILISCIDYFITNPHIKATQNESYEKQEKRLKYDWIFISLYRQYIHDMEYDGVTLLEMLQSGGLKDHKIKCGLITIKTVCKKVNWKTGYFCKIKKPLDQWARYIFFKDLDQRTPRDLHFYIYCNGNDTISYESFDKDTILSILEPIWKISEIEIDIIGLFSVKRENKNKGISLVLHTEGLEKSVSETNKGVNTSLKNVKGKSYTATCRNVWNRTKDKIYKIDDISADLKRWHKQQTFMFLTDFKEGDFDELLP